MNFVAIIGYFEVVEDKLFYFLEQISDNYGLLEISFEYLFLERIIRIDICALYFAFKAWIDVKLAH